MHHVEVLEVYFQINLKLGFLRRCQLEEYSGSDSDIQPTKSNKLYMHIYAKS